MFIFLIFPRTTKDVKLSSIKYKRDIHEGQYQQEKNIKHKKYLDETKKYLRDTNINTRLLAAYGNNDDNRLQTFVQKKKKTQSTAVIEGKVTGLNVREKSITTSSRHSKVAKTKHVRLGNKEIPFNVTGWPLGTSLSVEDYVDYFKSTAVLFPDTSMDSSNFHEDNEISVLIGISKFFSM